MTNTSYPKDFDLLINGVSRKDFMISSSISEEDLSLAQPIYLRCQIILGDRQGASYDELLDDRLSDFYQRGNSIVFRCYETTKTLYIRNAVFNPVTRTLTIDGTCALELLSYRSPAESDITEYEGSIVVNPGAGMPTIPKLTRTLLIGKLLEKSGLTPGSYSIDGGDDLIDFYLDKDAEDSFVGVAAAMALPATRWMQWDPVLQLVRLYRYSNSNTYVNFTSRNLVAFGRLAPIEDDPELICVTGSKKTIEIPVQERVFNLASKTQLQDDIQLYREEKTTSSSSKVFRNPSNSGNSSSITLPGSMLGYYGTLPEYGEFESLRNIANVTFGFFKSSPPNALETTTSRSIITPYNLPERDSPSDPREINDTQRKETHMNYQSGYLAIRTDVEATMRASKTRFNPAVGISEFKAQKLEGKIIVTETRYYGVPGEDTLLSIRERTVDRTVEIDYEAIYEEEIDELTGYQAISTVQQSVQEKNVEFIDDVGKFLQRTVTTVREVNRRRQANWEPIVEGGNDGFEEFDLDSTERRDTETRIDYLDAIPKMTTQPPFTKENETPMVAEYVSPFFESPFRARKLTINVDYATSQNQLYQVGAMWAKILQGRRNEYSLTAAITPTSWRINTLEQIRCLGIVGVATQREYQFNEDGSALFSCRILGYGTQFENPEIDNTIPFFVAPEPNPDGTLQLFQVTDFDVVAGDLIESFTIPSIDNDGSIEVIFIDLPPGIVYENGYFSGVLSVPGDYVFTYYGQDSTSTTDDYTFTITVIAGEVVIPLVPEVRPFNIATASSARLEVLEYNVNAFQEYALNCAAASSATFELQFRPLLTAAASTGSLDSYQSLFGGFSAAASTASIEITVNAGGGEFDILEAQVNNIDYIISTELEVFE